MAAKRKVKKKLVLKPVEPVEPEAVEPVEPEAVEHHYVVAEGRSISCKKGIIGPGGKVRCSYVSGGEKTIKNLVDKGILKKL